MQMMDGNASKKAEHRHCLKLGGRRRSCWTKEFGIFVHMTYIKTIHIQHTMLFHKSNRRTSLY